MRGYPAVWRSRLPAIARVGPSLAGVPYADYASPARLARGLLSSRREYPEIRMSLEKRSVGRELRNITLSQEDAYQAVRLLRLLSEALYGSSQNELPKPLDAQQMARVIFNARKARTRFLNRAMFGEPAWDVLLALFINEGAREKLTSSRLSELVEEPPSTITRWLNYLDKERLIERLDDPHDKRTHVVRLTNKGRSVMENYMAMALMPLGSGEE